VLGGSRARGLHTDASDYDIGIYYSSAEQFDFAALNQAAQILSKSPKVLYGDEMRAGRALRVTSD
jgi:predicted nucleotidyltransferase